METSGKGGKVPGRLFALLRLFIEVRRLRRSLMFYVCLEVLGLVGVGHFLMGEWLEARPPVFLGYWAFTCLSVILLMLLALYDILRTWREEGR